MNCKDALSFLDQIKARSITMQIPDGDLEVLQRNNFVGVLSKDQYTQMSSEVAQMLPQLSNSVDKEYMEAQGLNRDLAEEMGKTHSILFHFEGRDKKNQELQKIQQEDSTLKVLNEDIKKRSSMITELIQKKSILSNVVPYGDRYVSLTGNGMVVMRQLSVKLYRVSDLDFTEYLKQESEIMGELNGIADKSLGHFKFLSASIENVDPSHLWAVAVGLGKLEGDPASIGNSFLDAYKRVEKISSNEENRLMAAEILSSTQTDINSAMPLLHELNHEVHKAGVPKEASAGVTSILFFGRRYDGTFPVDSMRNFLQLTKSYEAAAILSIINRPYEEMAGKFTAMKSLFSSWGYQLSEDTELSSAYLTISDLPPEGFSTKLMIIVDGMRAYLEYPLVASAIVASIPVLEANETLNLLEEAYGIIGTRAMQLSQPELIGLAVRMIHGIKNEILRKLDTTGRIASNVPVRFTYAPSVPIFYYYLPVIMIHGSYYSTFSGIGGSHPGHIHGFGGWVVG